MNNHPIPWCLSWVASLLLAAYWSVSSSNVEFGVILLAFVGLTALYGLRRSLDTSPAAAPRSGTVSEYRANAGIRRHVVSVGLLSFTAVVLLGQKANSAEIPLNSVAKKSGTGWTCNAGFRKRSDECLAVTIPENAFAIHATYGSGYDCRRGYLVKGDACQAVDVPDNAFLDASGRQWDCMRGFKKGREGCGKIKVPVNGYLSTADYGSGWKCNYGFHPVNDACEAIEVPENGYLSGSSTSGKGWKCQRGYRAAANDCLAIAVPEHGYLTDSAHGKGWKCDRGYRVDGRKCVFVELPENAHLESSGYSWRCDPPDRKRQSECVIK